ncbi:hypothetical protein KO494_14310 [Lacinutrix sp. C3R15]|uniref:hypothetical protein n=1 Tax=Flavobacteriaceae TaxID=49546 RepID=UPI001C08E220|nr:MULTISPECIES: hypothetical protein [Flavobacteriaceae]MBU2940718.1 hypothetical protein [Lacinutrix sp. C3R15]MDO6624036.1 hypothetical protein [Oceanihabitans sp. 1_MG-2023]
MIFKQRKNKSFNYTPRHLREQEQAKKEDLASKWEEIRGTSKRKGSFFSSLPIMVLFLIAVLVLLYILGGYQ